MDVLTPAQRSYNMSRIKSKNTKPELAVFEQLEKLEIPFERHYPIYGKPDIVFPQYKIAVFIDGEFWHGRYFTKIKYRLTEFWIQKITNNKKRDKKSSMLLKQGGWTVIRLWDDDIKKNCSKEVRKITKCINKISQANRHGNTL